MAVYPGVAPLHLGADLIVKLNSGKVRHPIAAATSVQSARLT
jgi:hypothetical protein